jgi:hypothetical protein
MQYFLSVKTILRELDGFDHGGMAAPAHLLTIKYIRDRERK